MQTSSRRRSVIDCCASVIAVCRRCVVTMRSNCLFSLCCLLRRVNATLRRLQSLINLFGSSTYIVRPCVIEIVFIYNLAKDPYSRALQSMILVHALVCARVDHGGLHTT